MDSITFPVRLSQVSEFDDSSKTMQEKCRTFVDKYHKLIRHNSPDDALDDNSNDDVSESLDTPLTTSQDTSQDTTLNQPIKQTGSAISQPTSQPIKTSGGIRVERYIERIPHISITLNTTMFRILIALIVVLIVMIVVLVVRIELAPLINYKIPDDYTHFTMQPPKHNVKHYDINNAKGYIQPLKTLYNTVQDKIQNQSSPHSESFQTHAFSSNYNFGV